MDLANCRALKSSSPIKRACII